MEINAYAKLNLFLAVTGKRDDGYHDIETIMQSISLSDRLTIDRTESGKIELYSPSRFVPRDERNLAVKAALRFYEYAGIICDGLRIDLYKRIPVGAGMGGGSSDAAAVLLAMNQLYDTRFSMQELATLGATIGADVAFCVYGGAMKAEGIGEILSPVPQLPKVPILVVKPPVSVSTPKAYAAVDNFPPQQTPSISEIETALASGKITQICSKFFNTFQAPIAALHPQILDIREHMLLTGARTAMMTGSGSAVFGIYPNFSSAKKAAASLPKIYGQRYICQPVSGNFQDC